MNLGQKIILLFGLFVAGLFLFSIVGYGLGALLFGIEMSDFANYDDYRTVQGLKFVQAIVSIGTFIFPAYVYSRITNSSFLKYFGTNNLKPELLMVVTVLGICALPFIGWMAEMNMQMSLPESMAWLEDILRASEERAQEITEAFLAMNTTGELLINLLVIAVLPAIGEELLFRGVLQKTLIKHTGNIHSAIWISAAAFSFIHFQFFGFFPRMILGALFGYLVVWGGSLWYSIWAHFINNGVTVLLMYFIYKGKLEEDFETFGGNSGDWIYVLISLVFLLSLLWFFRQSTKQIHKPFSDSLENN